MKLLACAACLATLPLMACTIDVQKDEPGRKAVDIRTPVGNVSVRTGDTPPDTGLAVYPGARPSRQSDDDPENANVNVTSSAFGVQVRVAKYDSDDAQDKILDFYRKELEPFGEVTECRGNVDFKGPRGQRRPVCKEGWFDSEQVQLTAGTEGEHRIVAVKPHAGGAEIDLIYIKTKGEG